MARPALLLLGGVFLAIACDLNQAVRAESIRIPFSGTVPQTCSIFSDPQFSDSSPSDHLSVYNSNGTQIACNESAQVNQDSWLVEPGEHESASFTVTSNEAFGNEILEQNIDRFQTITPQ